MHRNALSLFNLLVCRARQTKAMNAHYGCQKKNVTPISFDSKQYSNTLQDYTGKCHC